MNVTFMGSSHATQDSYFDKVLEEQNTIFYAFMCGEACLYLLSVGPFLYVRDQSHRFDIFLITVTSLTMLFQDSLRSIRSSCH